MSSLKLGFKLSVVLNISVINMIAHISNVLFDGSASRLPFSVSNTAHFAPADPTERKHKTDEDKGFIYITFN